MKVFGTLDRVIAGVVISLSFLVVYGKLLSDFAQFYITGHTTSKESEEMSGFDYGQLMQFAGYGIFILFMLYGTKLQMWQMLAKIGQQMKKLVIMRDSSLASLKTHIRKYTPNI